MAESEVEDQDQGKKKRKITSFNLSEELMERVRDAAWWERTPVVTLVSDAIEAHLAELEKKNGGPYKPRRGDIPKGRPVK